MKAVAILNAKAGLCLQHGEGIARTVAEAFRNAGTSIEVTCVEPQQATGKHVLEHCLGWIPLEWDANNL